MNKLDPKVVGAVVAVLVVLAGFVVYKSTIGNHTGEPPPIAAGGLSSGQMTLPGADAVSRGSTLAPPGGANMTLPGGPPPTPGGGMQLPGAPH